MSQARKLRYVVRWEKWRLKYARRYPHKHVKNLYPGQIRAANRWAARWLASERRAEQQKQFVRGNDTIDRLANDPLVTKHSP